MLALAEVEPEELREKSRCVAARVLAARRVATARPHHQKHAQWADQEQRDGDEIAAVPSGSGDNSDQDQRH